MQKKVLVVDDVAEILQVFQHLLTQLGYQDITLVSTGKDALEQIQKQHFDLAFLDIELPDMSGTDILGYLQEHALHTDVVMCSAHNSVENVKLTWDKGAKGFLTKPVSPHKLKNLLRRLSMNHTQVA